MVDQARKNKYLLNNGTVRILALDRGLEQDLVITPYATGLALLISPEKAIKNLKKLYNDGVYGKFGYYEAIDFTPSRMPPNQNKQILHSYMAHHQGMIFLSCANVIFDHFLQELFEEYPYFSRIFITKTQ